MLTPEICHPIHVQLCSNSSDSTILLQRANSLVGRKDNCLENVSHALFCFLNPSVYHGRITAINIWLLVLPLDEVYSCELDVYKYQNIALFHFINSIPLVSSKQNCTFLYKSNQIWFHTNLHISKLHEIPLNFIPQIHNSRSYSE